MRLFIAAELPHQMIEALAETSALLRDAVPGRYVSSDSFHVTLAFLGNVEAHSVDALCDAIEQGCVGHGAFQVELGELGSFGKRSSATLWQGFTDERALRALANDVRSQLEHAGFSFDSKPFRAHVTLMRKADVASGTLPTACHARGCIDTVTLFKSDLSGPRPRYEALYQAKL